MTIANEILQYADDCLTGKNISGQKHKWACQRLINDWKKAETDPDYPYCWDEQKAQEIVDWFAYFTHSKGVLAGTPIRLTTWQKFVICQLYGWRKEDGNKRFNKMFIEVGRKNARDLASRLETIWNIIG